MTAEELKDLAQRVTVQFTTTGLQINNISFYELQWLFECAARSLGCDLSPNPPNPDYVAPPAGAVVVSGIDERGQRVGWEVDPRFLTNPHHESQSRS